MPGGGKSKAKKKAAVVRGFATTSVAKKVDPVIETPPADAPAVDDASQKPSKDDTAQLKKAVDEKRADELGPAEAELQRLAELLKPASDKEVSRLCKSIEYDRRLAKTFTAFTWQDVALKEEILRLAREEDAQAPHAEIHRDQEHKLISRMITIWAILERLGVGREHTEAAMRAVRHVELEEVLDWLALHAPESELDFQGPRQEAPISHTFLDTSVPATPALPLPAETSLSSSSTLPDTPAVEARSEEEPTSDDIKQRILQSDDREDEDETALAEDPIAAYVAAKLELLSIQRRQKEASTARKEALEDRMRDASSRYEFSAKEADNVFKVERAKMDAAELKERLSRPAADKPTKASKTTIKSGADSPAVPDSPATVGEGSEESMFGSLLDEAPTEELTADGTTIPVRNMSIPNKAKSPELLLKETIRSIDQYATVAFRVISQSRAVRAAVTIRWPGGRVDEFGMADVACQDRQQAFNCVAVLALHPLATSKVHLVLPAVFLELWEQLNAKAGAKKAQDFRDRLRLLQDIAGTRLTDVDEVRKATTKSFATTEDDVPLRPSTFAPATPSCELHQAFIQRQASTQYKDMLTHRAKLPIASFRKVIVDTVEANQVVILSGETGCGKSTQLPAFILEHWLSEGRQANILCTEPRRISAISLAQRVSRELGDHGPCGSRGALVGYNVRLESRTSPTTRLIYATTGIALRMLEGDNALDDLTHLIIDEVHERSIDSDFLMITLKDLLQRRPDLRVVLMSATVDSDKLSSYWSGCPVLAVPGRTFPVTPYFLEDVIELCQYRLDPDADSQYARRVRRGQAPRKVVLDDNDMLDSDEEAGDDLSLDAGKRYSKQTRTTLEVIDEHQINYELIIQLLEVVCLRHAELVDFSAATLIFCPSLESIRRLSDMLETHEVFGGPAFKLFPLHSTISNDNQSLVFDTMPPGVRKIVIATNIAETGITIPDITCVIDTGRHREMTYDEKRQISRLVESFIARSNAAQRRGRAGRVQEGIAFAMYTKHRHDVQFIDHPQPEMLRLSLQDLALRIKILAFRGSIADVLLQALDPPALNNIERAIAALVEVKALTTSEDITTLGRHLAKLPVDVHLGKLLLLGCLFNCLDATLTIVAALNAKSPWLTPFGRESEADAAKRSFKTENSDFLTLYKAFTSWREACGNGVHQQFCRRSFLSHQTLVQIEELRQQFFNLLVEANFADSSVAQYSGAAKARVRFLRVPPTLDTHSNDPKAVMACVASAMFPKVLVASDGGGWKTLLNSQAAHIHPTSVNFAYGRRPDFGSSTRYVAYFNIMQSKKLYVWESGPVDDQAVFSLCGGEVDVKIAAHAVILDRNRVRARVDPRTAIALKRLRARYVECLAARLKGKTWTPVQQAWWSLIERAIMSPEKKENSAAARKRETSSMGTVKIIKNA